MGAAIELGSRHARGKGDLGAVSEALTGIGCSAQEAPPALDQVQPSGPDGNEDLLDTRVRRQPVTDGSAGVTREVVGDEIEVAIGIVAIDGAEQVQIASGIACGSGLGADLPIPDAQSSIDPGFIVAAAVDEGRLDPVAIR
jgi:hypothetical protein